MASSLDLPAGFVLDELPEGFVLDNGQPQQKVVQPANVQYAQEHPVARTLGRTARAGLSGLASLVDIPLLVPKTAALAGSMAADALGYPGGSEALGKLGATPTMADTTRQLIDNATGGKLQDINGMEKGFSFLGELISSAVPFSKSGQMVNAVAPKPPTAGGALTAMLDPETAINTASKRAFLPVPQITDEGKRVATLAQQYDIPIGMDDVTDSKFYKTLISEGQSVPFSGSQKKIDTQLSKFTAAVARSVGLEDTQKLTVENIDKAFSNVGKEFDALTKGQTFTMNDDVAAGLNDILSVAENGGYGAEGVKLFNKYIADLGAVVDDSGIVDGETLAKLRSKLNAVSRKGSDLNAKTLASELEGVISDFITDGHPEALRQAKYRYKNLLAIEPLAAKDQIGGMISPSQLLGRVRQVYKRQFSRGNAGELGDLANIGQYIKESIPNSGTAQRTGARNLLTGNLMAMAPTAAFGGPLAAMAQGAVSVGAMGANRALQNRNFDTELMNLAMKNLYSKPIISQQGALAAMAGANQVSNQLRLPAPPKQITGY